VDFRGRGADNQRRKKYSWKGRFGGLRIGAIIERTEGVLEVQLRREMPLAPIGKVGVHDGKQLLRGVMYTRVTHKTTC